MIDMVPPFNQSVANVRVVREHLPREFASNPGSVTSAAGGTVRPREEGGHMAALFFVGWSDALVRRYFFCLHFWVELADSVSPL